MTRIELNKIALKCKANDTYENRVELAKAKSEFYGTEYVEPEMPTTTKVETGLSVNLGDDSKKNTEESEDSLKEEPKKTQEKTQKEELKSETAKEPEVE